jgi:hypothetical protein
MGYKQSDEPPDFLHFERLLYVAKQPLDLHKKDQLIGLLVTHNCPSALSTNCRTTVIQNYRYYCANWQVLACKNDPKYR